MSGSHKKKASIVSFQKTLICVSIVFLTSPGPVFPYRELSQSNPDKEINNKIGRDKIKVMKAAPVLKTVAEFIPPGSLLKKESCQKCRAEPAKAEPPLFLFSPPGVLGLQELFSGALMNMNDI